jgi:hypothetical protein
VWEENHITNVWRIREQHYQTVDTNATATSRRHTVLESANKVMVKVHCFLVTSFFLLYLFAEAIGLIFGII